MKITDSDSEYNTWRECRPNLYESSEANSLKRH